MALYIAAAKAARMRDLQAHVVTAEGKHRALALSPCATALKRLGPGVVEEFVENKVNK
jgi:hypothetical protein